MDPAPPHATRLKRDILQSAQALLAADSSLELTDAIKIAASRMLANNPFVPPTTGCPVNVLPNEILAHIFALGTKMEEEMESDDSDDEYGDQLDLLDGWDTDEDEGRVNPQGKVVQVDDEAMDTAVEDSDPSEDDEDDEKDEMPFQMLVSHVCQHWRNVVIESPGLWTNLSFRAGFSLDCARTWIQRSKSLPLDLRIDCTIPDDVADDEYNGMHPHDLNDSTRAGLNPCDLNNIFLGDTLSISAPVPERRMNYYSERELKEILNLIIPHVARWRSFELAVSSYPYMFILLSRLEQCGAAPLLEVLMLYHYETCDEYDEFTPPEYNGSFLLFHGNAPRLRETAFWGVHIAWEPSLSFLRDLNDLELAYHAKDVRPSFAVFQQLLKASPNLSTLTLCLSGPAGTRAEWGPDPIELSALSDLVLCYHDAAYIQGLMEILVAPNVHSLALDYDGGDYTEFARQLARPMPGKTQSLLAGLTHLKISGLPCNDRAVEEMLTQLGELRSINLNCSGTEEVFFDLLMKSRTSTGGKTVHCPRLETVTTTGIDGFKMRAFVELRRATGVPLKHVLMCDEDLLEERDEKWLRAHLESLEFFEASDSEEELDDELSEDDEEVESEVM